MQSFKIDCLIIHFNTTAAVPPGMVEPNTTLSSPSEITAAKNSSLWLHWNYIYGGDYAGFFKYEEQIIGYTSKKESTLVPLAKRNGINGTLVKQASIAGPFNGRIDVIPENSTLVVHYLRLNDSGTNFSSYIKILFGKTPQRIQLKPVVTVKVMGEFCVINSIIVIISKFNISKFLAAFGSRGVIRDNASGDA